MNKSIFIISIFRTGLPSQQAAAHRQRGPLPSHHGHEVKLNAPVLELFYPHIAVVNTDGSVVSPWKSANHPQNAIMKSNCGLFIAWISSPEPSGWARTPIAWVSSPEEYGDPMGVLPSPHLGDCDGYCKQKSTINRLVQHTPKRHVQTLIMLNLGAKLRRIFSCARKWRKFLTRKHSVVTFKAFNVFKPFNCSHCSCRSHIQGMNIEHLNHNLNTSTWPSKFDAWQRTKIA